MLELLLEVKGQTSALNILHNIYSSKRIPNAILLTGIEGIGKYYSAIQLLKLLNGNSNLINQKISTTKIIPTHSSSRNQNFILVISLMSTTFYLFSIISSIRPYFLASLAVIK